MLWAVIEDAWFINDVWKMLRMTRREAIVPPWLDVKQFVVGISVRQPGGTFLIGAKEIA